MFPRQLKSQHKSTSMPPANISHTIQHPNYLRQHLMARTINSTATHEAKDHIKYQEFRNEIENPLHVHQKDPSTMQLFLNQEVNFDMDAYLENISPKNKGGLLQLSMAENSHQL